MRLWTLRDSTARSTFGTHHRAVFTPRGRTLYTPSTTVEYLPDEDKYIVRLKHFRGQVEVEEAGFFVRSIDLETGEITLSNGSRERLDVSTLSSSPIDGALLCRIMQDSVSGGLLARFTHAVQAEFLQGVEVEGDRCVVSIGGERVLCPEF